MTTCWAQTPPQSPPSRRPPDWSARHLTISPEDTPAAVRPARPHRGPFADRQGADLDHDAILPARSGFPPDSIDDLVDWVAWFTTEVREARGVVTFVQQVPGARWVEPVGRYTLLAFEARWHTLRSILTRHGLGLTTAPPVTSVDGVGWEPPRELLDRLNAETESVRGRLAEAFAHLGGDVEMAPRGPPPLARLGRLRPDGVPHRPGP